jgi:hypothetical protein
MRQQAASRCPACQLQICKSRVQPPHALLTEVKSDESSHGRETFYNCQTCGITLINSSDLGKPGWRQAPAVERAAQMPPNQRPAMTAHA